MISRNLRGVFACADLRYVISQIAILFLLTFSIMTFIPEGGTWSTVKLPTKASTTYTQGMFLYQDETDMVPCATTSQNNLIGIAKEAKASTSATTSIHVHVPTSPWCTFRSTGGSGTLTKAQEGDQFDFASTGLTIAQAASTYDPVILVKYISATEGVFRLNVLHGKD
jgi:hypothetical protein